MRALSQRNDEPRARLPSLGQAIATDSWWAKAPASWCWRNWSSRSARGAHDPGRNRGLRHERRRVSHHLAAENGDGAYRVMRNALRTRSSSREQIDYINAHGTSTEVGDKIETMAIKRAVRRSRL